MATSNTAAVDAKSWGEYVAISRQISIVNKRYPNTDYGVSLSFAFAICKTQGSRKTSDWKKKKNRRKEEF